MKEKADQRSHIDQDIQESPPMPYLYTSFPLNPVSSLTGEVLDAIGGQASHSEDDPPPLSATMRTKIAYILRDQKTLYLSDVQDEMWLMYADYYKSHPVEWKKSKNTIRHRLSNSPEFMKIDKTKVRGKRGRLWMLDPDYAGLLRPRGRNRRRRQRTHRLPMSTSDNEPTERDSQAAASPPLPMQDVAPLPGPEDDPTTMSNSMQSPHTSTSASIEDAYLSSPEIQLEAEWRNFHEQFDSLIHTDFNDKNIFPEFESYY
ncbi:hypothetical protein FRC02_001170 [Tulasnella sp. 418]|nr:hypothetical protein FRC02_001170 [Tulasnella sp. 418]